MVDSPAAINTDEPEDEEDDDDICVVGVVSHNKQVNESTAGSSNSARVNSKDRYRIRRRKIRRMLQPGAVPSFLRLIVGDDDSDEEEDIFSGKDVIRIDVDEYLGLKKAEDVSTGVAAIPDYTSSAAKVAARSTSEVASSQVSPADEGWYEGVVSPITMADDAEYLSEMHLLVRRNLEFFSATNMDTAISQAGRRTPTVLGKVGLRCIHCNNAAKLFLEQKKRKEANTDDDDYEDQPEVAAHQLWPPGSISYPINIAGLYAVCAQKPQLHFEKCPNLPPDVKADFLRILREEPSSGTPRKRQRQSVGNNNSGISAIMYYSIAAKRIGLVDVPGGMRFGRDLSLEPLSIEAVRNQVEDRTKSSSKRLSGSHLSSPTNTSSHAASSPARVSSPDAVPSGSTERVAADPESESVLADAIAQQDDPTKYLARSEDKSLVTDFIFLIIRQMAICRAVPSDLASRGKKTKLMRVGFAGFCCRHCMVDAEGKAPVVVGDYCCRSFSSAADNLASAISNSFVLHLQKCYRVPALLKKALSAYKRVHSRQMAQLPYGSQRRLFHALWTRLREADIPEEEMMEQLKAKGALFAASSNASSVESDDIETLSTLKTPTQPPDTEGNDDVDDEVEIIPQVPAENIVGSTDSPLVVDTRPASFPVCEDQETQATLRKAEEEWNQQENDSLIIRSDRPLVTDYVFLTMRQLKVVLPTAVDKSRIRKATQGPLHGMCCKYCLNAPSGHMVTPSGRSFPSAPDNMASALNTSLYNHMQNCYLLPEELKRALFHLKKIHSVQCASLKFGSQRRYFNLVFERLRKIGSENSMNFAVAMEATKPDAGSADDVTTGKPRSTGSRLDTKTLTECNFAEGPSGTLSCLRCRMVPFEFRKAGSILLQRPTTNHPLFYHLRICEEDRLDLSFCVEKMQDILQQSNKSADQLLADPLFGNAVRLAVGGNEALMNVFGRYVLESLQEGNRCLDDDDSEELLDTSGLWSQFPTSVDVEAVSQAVKQYAKAANLRDHECVYRYLRLISPVLYNNSFQKGWSD